MILLSSQLPFVTICLNKHRLYLFSYIFVNFSIFECANQRLVDSHRWIIYDNILSFFYSIISYVLVPVVSINKVDEKNFNI